MENIKKVIEKPLEEINLKVDDVYYVKGNPSQLNIVLDSDDIIDINKIVDATNIISPLIDEVNFTDEQYILDVYSKEKGVIDNE